MKYLFCILALLLAVHAYSPEPLPSCSNPKNLINQFPVSLHEIQTYHLDEYFTGFNLEFSIPSSHPDFIQLIQKSSTLKTEPLAQPGLRSYHL